MFIVGLTGGIGSGKTTVANIFKTLNVPVYDSDTRAKYLMNNDVILKRKISKLLGSQAYDANGLNRKYVAKIVFNNKNILHKLEELVHPAVKVDFKKWAKQQGSDYVVMENAILFKSGMHRLVDYIIFVTSPVEIRQKRVVKRDGLLIEQVKSRIKNQDIDEYLLKKSDFVLKNNGCISELSKKIKKMDLNLKKMLKKR